MMQKKLFNGYEGLISLCLGLGCPRSIIDYEIRRRAENLKITQPNAQDNSDYNINNIQVYHPRGILKNTHMGLEPTR